jgi:heme/copper-type cytochrome/quinol oxidase subunit 2
MVNAMSRPRLFNTFVIAVLLLLGGGTGLAASRFATPAPQDRYITIKAHKYAYEPAVLKINKGDRVFLTLVSSDVTHGFFLEGYDLDAQVRPGDFSFQVRHPSESAEYKPTEEVSFVANRTGKFRYRCSTTCGYMHPFMQGEMIVSPNSLFPTSIGMLAGLAFGMMWISRRT